MTQRMPLSAGMWSEEGRGPPDQTMASPLPSAKSYRTISQFG